MEETPGGDGPIAPVLTQPAALLAAPSRVRRIVINSCALCCCIAHAHAADSLAQTMIGDFAGAKLSVVEVAARLAQSHVPVGVEAINGPEPSPFDLDLKNATAGDVLKATVYADPRYKWKESNGVINLLPKKHRDPVFGIVIHHFEAINEMPEQMITQLLSAPEVKKYLDHRKVQAGVLTAGSFLFTPGAPPKIIRNSLVVENETLRHALNDALLKTGSFYWCGFFDEQNHKKVLLFQVW